MSLIKACVDRPLMTHQQQLLASQRAIEENASNASPADVAAAGMTKLVLDTQRRWKPGRVLRVCFLEGEAQLRERVAQAARAWSDHCSIQFDFVVAGGVGTHMPEIRVRFGDNGDHSCWSRVGTDCLVGQPHEHTMNLGWLDANTSDGELRRVVLHEFGHALGLLHEHQSPVAAIPWNKAAVYSFYAQAPNYWGNADVDFNILQRYAASHTQFSTFDPHSIMVYPIPATLTANGFEIAWNNDLSAMDKSFIRHLYP